ncbi:MAG TPA: F0F1 ATP synthase subunit delta [Patescibacteria group bacterium]|nr:F0F1 ATP synthase subunit delta [Patescibacteria group bacterium]
MNTARTIVVETVIPLSAEQKKAVAAMLKQKFDTETFSEKINSEILGGVRIMVDSTQYDASLLGKLTQLRNA